MSDPSQAAALIAAKRAEIQAKLARMQSNNVLSPRPPAPQRSQPQPPQPQPLASVSRPPPSSPAPPISGLSLSEIQRKKDEVLNRISLKFNEKAMAPPPMPLDSSGNFDLKAMLDKGIIPKRETELKAKARLSASSSSRQPTPTPAAPKPSSSKKKQDALKTDTTPESSNDATKNPYYDPSLPASITPKGRRARPLRFVQPGKYVELGNQERRKAALERLKEEVAAKVKQAGMETEMDVADKSLKKEPPPVAEWWDVPFLPTQNYQDLDDKHTLDPEKLTSLVTSYVHHPVPIKPPSELNGKPPSRALMLTKKERKKLRRQRRNETQKDKQDKIRLGLLPPDAPKVKISNLMKVLGDEAIQDPTKIEAKVRKEMEERQRQHEMANEQRKLTPAERRAKLMNRMANDQSISNEVAVFKIKNCSHPKHRYKIEKNAQQYGLTGIVIVHHKCHMVIVEGGPKGIKAYKKLMLRRIDWNDMPVPKNAANLDTSSVMTDEDHSMSSAMDGENACYLVWTGQVKAKAFKKFTWRSFESEKMARKELTNWHAENYWDACLMATDEELAMRQPDL